MAGSSAGNVKDRFRIEVDDFRHRMVTCRPPGATDDMMSGYDAGDVWNDLAGTCYACESNATGAARWRVEAIADAPPVDAIGGGAPLGAYGTRRLRAAYAGPALNLVRDSDGRALDIGFCADGALDPAALLGFLAGTAGRVVTLYDQSGNANHITQTEAACRPLITPGHMLGNSLPVIFDSQRQGTTTTRYMDIPASLTLGSQNMAVVTLASARSTARAVGILSLNGMSNRIAYGFGATNDRFYLSYGTAYEITPRAPLTPFVSGFRSSGKAVGIWLDHTQMSGGPHSNQVLAGGELGRTPFAALGGYVDVSACLIYGRSLSDTERLAANASLYRSFGIAPQVRDVLLCDGDSITEGHGCSGNRNWTRQALPLLARPVRMFNAGGFGQTAVQRSRAFGTKSALAYDPAARRNVFVLCAGTNDLRSNAAPDTVYAAIADWVQQVRALGSNTVALLGTILPRAFFLTGGSPAGQQETNRLTLNALIRANAAGADGVIDFAADPIMGLSSATADRSLFIDGTHPTSLGYICLAQVAARAINSFLTCCPHPPPPVGG